MWCARLFLATYVALSCCTASSADDMDVGDFLSRCSDLEPVLTGKKDADLDDQLNLSWCTGHLSDSGSECDFQHVGSFRRIVIAAK